MKSLIFHNKSRAYPVEVRFFNCRTCREPLWSEGQRTSGYCCEDCARDDPGYLEAPEVGYGPERDVELEVERRR